MKAAKLFIVIVIGFFLSTNCIAKSVSKHHSFDWSENNLTRKKRPKGFKLDKSFGFSHNQKIYKHGNHYFSPDADRHNGGYWKVFERKNGRLRRIGTADKLLNIFRK